MMTEQKAIPSVKETVDLITEALFKLRDRDSTIFGDSNFVQLTDWAVLVKGQYFNEDTAVLYYREKFICETGLYYLKEGPDAFANKVMGALSRMAEERCCDLAESGALELFDTNILNIYPVTGVINTIGCWRMRTVTISNGSKIEVILPIESIDGIVSDSKVVSVKSAIRRMLVVNMMNSNIENVLG